MLVVDGTFCTIPTIGILWGGSFFSRRDLIAVKLLTPRQPRFSAEDKDKLELSKIDYYLLLKSS